MQVDDDGGYLHLPHRLVALGESVAARRAGRHAVSWAGGRFGDGGGVPAGPQPGDHDPRRDQHLDPARTRADGADTSIVVDPGPLDEAHLGPLQEAAGRRHAGAAHARSRRPLRGSQGVRLPRRLRRARPRPAAPPRRGGPGRGRRGRPRRPGGARRRHPGPHQRLAVLRAALGAARCSPATRCSAGGPPWWPTPTASSAPTSTRSTACATSASAQDLQHVWPGHGPVIDDALGALDFYLAHRRDRLEQVREALRDARRGRLTARGRRARVRRRRPGPVGSRRAVGARAAGAPARTER